MERDGKEEGRGRGGKESTEGTVCPPAFMELPLPMVAK